VREGTIELTLDPKPLAGTQLSTAAGLREQAFRSNRGINGRCIVPSQKARLQLRDPIPKLAGHEVRLTLKVSLHPKLVELLVVQRAELTGQATEVSDECGLYVGAVV
jgi:hypothetical protein